VSASDDTHAPAVLALTLDDDTLGRLARLVALELSVVAPANPSLTSDGWLDAKAAAEYLGFTSTAPLHKLTARRQIAFSQDVAGGKCWFRRCDLDAYRFQTWIDARS
jgi:hypothetical protein